MRKIFPILILISGYFSPAYSQKTISDPNAEKRNVSGFHGIDVATGIKLILTKGNSEEVVVSASKTEFREKIVTRVENGILKIHYETKMGAINKKNESKNLKAYVSYTILNELYVSTGAEVEIEGILSSASLELRANTGGLVKGELNVNKLKVSQNTGSKITVSGKTGILDILSDTGSKFSGEDLSAGNCFIEVSTGAGVVITVEKEMNARANTGGYIKYKGEGGIRDIKTNTGGSVSKI